MKFIVYADIHHDEYAAKCLTLQDTLEVERQIFARSAEGNFDFLLFVGDRFLKREPKDEVKVLADQVILEGLARQKENFGYFHLVGNHDRVDNTLHWHTAQALSRQIKKGSILPGIMETPGTYLQPSLPIRVHALPAGYKFDVSKYEFDPSCLNIFAFHDIVRGATSDEEGKHIFEDGISIEEIDLPKFDIVYAGDIHVPQKFAFKNTKGGYVGAVVQRTRADSNKPRGWLEVEATQENNTWVTKTAFVPTRNFFTRLSFEVDDKTTYSDLVRQIDDIWVADQAVELRLKGNKLNVDRLADTPEWKNYTDVVPSRRFDILREYQTEQTDAVVNLSETHSPREDLELYLGSGFAELGSLSEEKLFSIVERAYAN